MVGSVAVGACVAYLREAFSWLTGVGIRSGFFGNPQLEAVEFDSSRTIASRPFKVAYDRGV